MPLCASAGIMEGDRQEFDFSVAEGTDMEFCPSLLIRFIR